MTKTGKFCRMYAVPSNWPIRFDLTVIFVTLKLLLASKSRKALQSCSWDTSAKDLPFATPFRTWASTTASYKARVCVTQDFCLVTNLLTSSVKQRRGVQCKWLLVYSKNTSCSRKISNLNEEEAAQHQEAQLFTRLRMNARMDLNDMNLQT